MIDLEKIGHRIHEQRKYILKISQEKMAEDLNMYQADISNMEKAKSGSGISDLNKLDLFADYFGIPLETLLFGREGNNMLTYHGNQMKLAKSKRKLSTSRIAVLRRLTGNHELEESGVSVYSCGPYEICTAMECLASIGGGKTNVSGHTYVFFEGEVIAVMTADYTTLLQHIDSDELISLQGMIPYQVLDVTDVWRTLNPYAALWQYTEEGEEKEKYAKQYEHRMRQLYASGENRPVLYVESVYVREDCRRHGIFRMYTDFLKQEFDGCVIWLNLEPTSGTELEQQNSAYPSYSVSELGQINMNASVAERVGFRVDPDTWHRTAESVDADGNTTTETVLIRKCAYYLPAEIRNIVKNDGDLVALGRARQKIVQAESPENGDEADLEDGFIDGKYVSELKLISPGKAPVFVSAVVDDGSCIKLYVSLDSVLHNREARVTEQYASPEDAEESEYRDELDTVNSFATLHRMRKDPEDDDSDRELNAVEEKICVFSNDTGVCCRRLTELKLTTDDGKAPITMFALTVLDGDGSFLCVVSSESVFDGEQFSEERYKALSFLEIYRSEEELQGSEFAGLFHDVLTNMKTDEWLHDLS